MLQLALYNLVSNAIKYTPDGGHIYLTATGDENQIRISIKDTGIGVAKDEQGRIFERFHTAGDTQLHSTSKTAFRGGGLGLGLAVCKGIVDAHGGKIWAESPGFDPDKLPGSEFVVILPVTARDEEWEPTTQESMFNFVRLSDGGIHRLDYVRPESWILGQLGRRMLPYSPIDFEAFSGHSRLRDAIAAIVPGMEELADIDVAKREFHIRNRVLHTPTFATTDGKAHFVVTPLPAPPAGRLMLASVRSEGQFNSIIYEETDSYRGKAGRDSVFLNAEDMAERGLSEGQGVRVTSDVGEMRGVATRFDLPRGSVLAYYPEANVLVGTAVEPRSKTPAFKSVPVQVEALPQPV